MPSIPLLAVDPPAGGAPIDQVIVATAFGALVTVALGVLCLGHRSGRVGVLSWSGRLAERVSPLPAWAALPAFIALVSLLPTLFGLQWDESLHVGIGRDDGPLANPSHYLLLQGIFGSFACGLIAMAMADDRDPGSFVSIPGMWSVPVGGLVATVGAGVALVGFPLDDVWHRLYGQDVTLWSPTHVMMISGVSISVLGILMLIVEGLRSAWLANARAGLGTERERAIPHRGWGWGPLGRLARLTLFVMVPAALLLVLSLLQGEMDFGVPQYRLLFHPMVVLGAAAVALVAARICFGRGAALAAVAGFVVIRGVIALLVGPVLGEPDHVFPLYIAEALIVEAVAVVLSTRRPLVFGLASGALIGTVGLAAEWAYSGVFAYEWTSALLPEVLFLGPGMALAGGVIGAWLGSHLRVRAPIRTAALRRGAVVAAVAITAMIGYGLHESGGDPIRGSVTLTDVETGPQRTVNATVRLDPPDAADDAEWMSAIAWQGGGLVSEPMREVAPGVYRTESPLPVHGEWKSGLRIHVGDRLLALPVFAPADDAIPVDEIPAPASFERAFDPEKKFLQREAKDVGSGLLALGTLIVALLCFALLGIAAAGLHRLAATAPTAPPQPDPDSAAGASPPSGGLAPAPVGHGGGRVGVGA